MSNQSRSTSSSLQLSSSVEALKDCTCGVLAWSGKTLGMCASHYTLSLDEWLFNVISVCNGQHPSISASCLLSGPSLQTTPTWEKKEACYSRGCTVEAKKRRPLITQKGPSKGGAESASGLAKSREKRIGHELVSFKEESTRRINARNLKRPTQSTCY